MEIIIPLKQHLGGINKAIVKKCDRVYRGELIAVPEGLGANTVNPENRDLMYNRNKVDLLEIEFSDIYL